MPSQYKMAVVFEEFLAPPLGHLVAATAKEVELEVL